MRLRIRKTAPRIRKTALQGCLGIADCGGIQPFQLFRCRGEAAADGVQVCREILCAALETGHGSLVGGKGSQILFQDSQPLRQCLCCCRKLRRTGRRL